MSNRRISRQKNQSGMSLVELIVASAIMILLMGAITVLLAKTFFVNKYTIEQGLNNAQMQNAIRKLSLQIREARQSDAGDYLIKTADDFDLVFYANIDDDSKTERVHYYLDENDLMMGITEAAGFPPVYPSNDQETRVIGVGITNDDSQSLFSYYNKEYPEDVVNNPLATPAQVDQISMIKLHVYANVDPKHVPNSMEMETFVKPRNIFVR